MSTRTFSLLFVFSVFAIVSVGAGAEQFTYVDLIRQLTDLERLAVLPADGEKCQQWSSYDRASKYDAAAKYVAWDASTVRALFARRRCGVFAEIEGAMVI